MWSLVLLCVDCDSEINGKISGFLDGDRLDVATSFNNAGLYPVAEGHVGFNGLSDGTITRVRQEIFQFALSGSFFAATNDDGDDETVDGVATGEGSVESDFVDGDGCHWHRDRVGNVIVDSEADDACELFSESFRGAGDACSHQIT